MLARCKGCLWCSFVVVVEKDAVFQRLVEEGFCGATNSILVTAKGMPDLCTRAFLQVLTSFYPTLRSVAGEHPQQQLTKAVLVKHGHLCSNAAMLASSAGAGGLDVSFK